jgi:hypothetical protein
MGPQFQRMDEKKVEQIENTQYATACFVEKKRGRYLYYDVSSNRLIAPVEYERRYLLMLQDTHKIRSRDWAQHFRQVTALVQEEAVDLQSIIPNKDGNENEQAAGQEESPLEMRDDDDLQAMDICDTSTSFVLGDDLADNSTDMNPTTSTNPCDESSSSSSSKGGDEGQEIVLDEKGGFRALPSGFEETVASPSSDNESYVLPLPSREEESSDPEFARAEQKLWGAIDHALEEYSRDLLSIQTARRMGVPSNVLTL